jgi:hypothetical protein
MTVTPALSVVATAQTRRTLLLTNPIVRILCCTACSSKVVPSPERMTSAASDGHTRIVGRLTVFGRSADALDLHDGLDFAVWKGPRGGAWFASRSKGTSGVARYGDLG